MIELENHSKIEEYYKNPRVSNSLLGTMNNPRLVKLKRDRPDLFEDDEYRSFRIGSAVDCLLTDPSRWSADFIVSNVTKPTGILGKFVSKLPAGLKPDSPSEDYYTAYMQSGYKMNIDYVIRSF